MVLMTGSIETLLQAPVLSGASARSGKDADRIDGVKPRLVVEPSSVDDVAALLAWASRERLSVVFRGGGSKLAWGRTPQSIDVLIGMRRLSRVLAHADADLTATVEAGATIEEVNDALGRSRQWLPIDGPDGATIGGAIATNDSGPLRHRYGTPRDLLIGVQLAMCDGRVIKAGGNVVKNVAGYDLAKLVSGSFGSLAAIVSATFKLLPVPVSWQTLIATFRDRDAAVRAITDLNDSQLEPVAVEIHAASFLDEDAPLRLLVRFGGAKAAVAAQAAQALTLFGNGEVIAADAEAAAWRRYVARSSSSADTIVRMNWLPSKLQQVLALVDELVPARRASLHKVELIGRAALGAGLLRIEGEVEWQVSVVERLRARTDLVSHVTLRDAPLAVKQQVDAWGPLGDAGRIAGVIKRALDPMEILNANRGPI
jgi:glycolate oxidase FAD binding subunit